MPMRNPLLILRAVDEAREILGDFPANGDGVEGVESLDEAGVEGNLGLVHVTKLNIFIF